MEHTPTPWTKSKVDFDKEEWMKLHSQTQICVGKGMNITAIVYGPDDQEEANAAFIVRAVNAFDDLKETIRWMAQTFHQAHHQDQPGTFRECPKNICDAAKQAIAKAEVR